MKLRRRHGATLGLVAVCTLVLIALGIGCFFLIKLLGGGRELANATDSGILNVAKQAIKNPNFDLNDPAIFPNPEIRNNFATLGDTPGSILDLRVYNRLVLKSLIVALNAKDEGTVEAAQNAKRLWNDLNFVAAKLTGGLKNGVQMGAYFVDLADANTTKMLDKKNVAPKDYATSFMKRDGFTNLIVSTNLLQAVPGGSGAIPTVTSSSGKTYVTGYRAIPVDLPITGDKLVYSGVTVNANDKPHLVSLGDFNILNTDTFVAGTGSPAYPGNTLPPNSFKSAGETSANRVQLLDAIGCAIVGSVTSNYDVNFEDGYIKIANGKSGPGPSGPIAQHKNDIFGEKISNGVITQGDDVNDLFSDNMPLWDAWAAYNNGTGPMPSLTLTQQDIRKGNGLAATLAELSTIKNKSIDAICRGSGSCTDINGTTYTNKSTDHYCIWDNYYDPIPDAVCLNSVDNFKKGWNMYGSYDTNSSHIAPTGWTALEQFKVEVLVARGDPNLRTSKLCLVPKEANDPSKPLETGVKWFQQNQSSTTGIGIAAPSQGPYNFGKIQTPYKYMEMINFNDACALSTALNALVQRCQEIKPGTSVTDVKALLDSQMLPLDSVCYIYYNKGTKRLTMTAANAPPPPTAVPGTVADGPVKPGCGTYYEVVDSWVNALEQSTVPFRGAQEYNGDGYFCFPFGKGGDKAQCADQIFWKESSGFNNLLGELRFQNRCRNGGRFSKPN